MIPSTPISRLRHYFTHGFFPQLRVFEACARLGSFSRAAEELCVAQPTVSCQMRKLNQTLGILLFDMSGKKVTLTPAGHELQNLCTGLFAQFTQLERRLSTLKQPSPPTVRIATTGSNQYLVANALSQWAQSDETQVDVQIVNRRRLIELLQEGQHDLYFVEELSEFDDFDITEIRGQELWVLGRQDHPLAFRNEMPLSELAGEYWVLRETGSGAREAISQKFSREDFVPRMRATLGSNDAIRSAILDGTGIGVLPQSLFRKGFEAEGLVRLSVRGFPLRHRSYAVLPHEQSPAPAVASAVAALIVATRLRSAVDDSKLI